MESLEDLCTISDKAVGDYTVAACTVFEEEQFQPCLSLTASLLLGWKPATTLNKYICSYSDTAYAWGLSYK